jgi:hypothetical protein
MTSNSTVTLGSADAPPRCRSSLVRTVAKEGPDARSIMRPHVRENYGLQIRLAFIGKPVRMSGQANELIGRFDKIFRSHGGVLAERHVVLAPDVEGRNANLAGGNVEIVVMARYQLSVAERAPGSASLCAASSTRSFGTRGSNAARSLRAPPASKANSGEPSRSRKKRT